MTGERLCALACLALAAACGGPEALERADDSRIVQVMVEETDQGLLNPAPAYAEAADICGRTMQRAVFFRGDDLGDRRLLHFRCE